MKRNPGIILVVLCLGIGGCFTPDPKSLTSDNPASSIPAIKEASDKNDRSAIPRLVVDLDDDDPAVRFAAISALERMTGQTLEYRYYEDTSERKPAIDRWRQWLAEHPQAGATKSR